jgi:hypothetical protein
MKLAYGARPILDARLNGYKPSDMVIVSLIGKTAESNTIVYANEQADYDWRWVQGLDICIYAKSHSDWWKTAMAIARSYPNLLILWDIDRYEGAFVSARPVVEDIDKPSSEWRYGLHFIPWLKVQNEEFAWN